MTEKYARYRAAQHVLPEKSWTWNMYGAGMESIGRAGEPEALPIEQPGPDQLLVRIDTVGMCFSDLKIIRQGSAHPKLYNRDLSLEPTRLGHEVALTVIAVGDGLTGRYHPGQRLAVQPDIYQQGRSTAYGYTIPGGLTQYHLIGPEVLETDAGACLLPLDESDLIYAAAALLEPWGCVVAAYTQRRRLEPLAGGTMWIVGAPGDAATYDLGTTVSAPKRVILTNVSTMLEAAIRAQHDNVVVHNDLNVADYAAWAKSMTDGNGFDDVVVLNPTSAAAVTEIAHQVARRGTLNLVGQTPLDGHVNADVGRLHYDYIAFVGNPGPAIDASYGEARNRCELRPNGAAVFIGAGGPMGQMHVQRAIERPAGPRLVIATDINTERLEALATTFGPLADANDRELLLYNPMEADESLYDFVMRATQNAGADDVIVSVPSTALMEEAGTLMRDDGMLVLFAGVPNGSLAPLNVSDVYLGNAQFTGTSGLTIDDQRLVLARAQDGSLSPERSVAAIGGLNVAPQALQAVLDGAYPGKIVIFPQLLDLPLLGLDELDQHLPQVAAALGPNLQWTEAAEQILIETCWQDAS